MARYETAAPAGDWISHVPARFGMPLIALGVLQILIGLGLFIIDIITFSYLGGGLAGNWYTAGGGGIWLGIMSVIAGILGCMAGRALLSTANTATAYQHHHYTRDLLLATMLMSLLWFLASIGFFIYFAVLVSQLNKWDSALDYYRGQYGYDNGYAYQNGNNNAAALQNGATVYQNGGVPVYRQNDQVYDYNPASSTAVYVVNAPNGTAVANGVYVANGNNANGNNVNFVQNGVYSPNGTYPRNGVYSAVVYETTTNPNIAALQTGVDYARRLSAAHLAFYIGALLVHLLQTLIAGLARPHVVLSKPERTTVVQQPVAYKVREEVEQVTVGGDARRGDGYNNNNSYGVNRPDGYATKTTTYVS